MDPVERWILMGIIAAYRTVQAVIGLAVVTVAFFLHWVLGLIAAYAFALAVSALLETRRQRFPSPEP